MPTVISGILKDGMGKPIPNCTIELKALRTSTTVITKTIASQQPEKNGSYSMNVEAGKYSVTLCVEGYPPNRVGEIYVHSESVPGTLNYYLGLPTEGDLPPAAIQQFEAMVELVSQQAAQVEKDKAAAAKSAADALVSQTAAKTSETNAGGSAAAALVSEKAAKTSETNTAKGIEAAAASAQAAKLSETNADGSKKAAQASAAEALASQGAAKTSETNASNSAKAASGSADKAKSEADRANAAMDGKQDKNALLAAIAALNTAADQIITLTGNDSVATTALTQFAKEMLTKTDADGVREYLGLNESLNEKADSNDERFETIDGKTGGVIKSPITGFGIHGGTSVLAPWEASPYRVNDRFSPTYDSYMPTLSYGVGGNDGSWRSMISSGAIARQSAHPVCIIASVGYDYDLNSRESREGHNLSYERSATGAPIMGSGRPDGSGYYSVTFNISSDERMKSDIKDLPNECALKKICALNYISFRFNECSGRNTKELRRGFSAQQAMIVDPQYVSVDRPSSLVNQSENIEVLRLDSNVLLLDALAAIKALNEKIEYLQSKLNEWKRE
ncbi:prophage tail fiber N-terminal domain-containing protein [Hafnia alvei]|uniref:prophage tail fiber N-terminal domain-containing protein n=1 Tax=Hafnia alvei TaxID=569 RepID=UPI0024A7C903|nr:prophage tail fiber N-terminal domain-containing protein [Hafnia alvei]